MCSAACSSEGFAPRPEATCEGCSQGSLRCKGSLYLQNQAGISHPDPRRQLLHAKPWGCKCSGIPAARLLGTGMPAWAEARASGQGWILKIPSLLHRLALHTPATTHPQADPTNELKAREVLRSCRLRCPQWQRTGHIHMPCCFAGGC